MTIMMTMMTMLTTLYDDDDDIGKITESVKCNAFRHTLKLNSCACVKIDIQLVNCTCRLFFRLIKQRWNFMKQIQFEFKFKFKRRRKVNLLAYQRQNSFFSRLFFCSIKRTINFAHVSLILSSQLAKKSLPNKLANNDTSAAK